MPYGILESCQAEFAEASCLHRWVSNPGDVSEMLRQAQPESFLRSSLFQVNFQKVTEPAFKPGLTPELFC
jgi:hypothetical protein